MTCLTGDDVYMSAASGAAMDSDSSPANANDDANNDADQANGRLTSDSQEHFAEVTPVNTKPSESIAAFWLLLFYVMKMPCVSGSACIVI